jgi:hypothetical protein
MHPFCLGLATTSARAALRLKAGRQPYASARQARTTFLESSLSLQRQPASAITADHHCESQLDPLSLLLFHKAEKVWRDFREPAVPSGNRRFSTRFGLGALVTTSPLAMAATLSKRPGLQLGNLGRPLFRRQSNAT